MVENRSVKIDKTTCMFYRLIRKTPLYLPLHPGHIIVDDDP